MQQPVNKKKAHPKRRRLLYILLGLSLALSVALVWLLPSIKTWFPAQRYATPTREEHHAVLAQMDDTQLSAITIDQTAGDSYTLRSSGGKLMLERDGELMDINDAAEEELKEAATVMAISDTVATDAAEVAAHLPDMGLAPAQITVTVSYADGQTDTLEIGYSVPETTYYYFRWSGDPGVYMCDVGVYDAFSRTVNLLLPIAQPVLVKSLISEVQLGSPDSRMTMSFTTDTAGYTSGSLITPYRYPLDDESAAGVLTALENFRLGALEGPVTAENRISYGFDAPISVLYVHQNAGAYSTVDENGQLIAAQMQEQELRFVLGRAEGEYFYTCEYEGNAYLVSRFLIETLLSASPSKWVAHNPADMGGAELSSIVVQTGAGSLDIRVSRTETVLPNNQLETDEDGNMVYDVSATVNGKPMAIEQYNALVLRLKAMAASGDVPEGWSPGNASPRWQLTLTTTGGTTRSIAAYTMDAFADALMVDGVIRHYAHVEALDIVLGELAAEM